VVQTGTFVPVHALGEEQHAYCRLILSSPMPLVYLRSTPHMHAFSREALHHDRGKKNGGRTIKVVDEHGSQDFVRIVRGIRCGPLGQRFRKGGLHDELPLSRNAASDPPTTGRSFDPTTGTEHRSLREMSAF
jgi:hypothetical protein